MYNLVQSVYHSVLVGLYSWIWNIFHEKHLVLVKKREVQIPLPPPPPPLDFQMSVSWYIVYKRGHGYG